MKRNDRPLEEVRRALANRETTLDELTPVERAAFMEDLGDRAGVPTPEELAFLEDRRQRGLGVGMVDGKLMRALPGGEMEEVKPRGE